MALNYEGIFMSLYPIHTGILAGLIFFQEQGDISLTVEYPEGVGAFLSPTEWAPSDLDEVWEPFTIVERKDLSWP